MRWRFEWGRQTLNLRKQLADLESKAQAFEHKSADLTKKCDSMEEKLGERQVLGCLSTRARRSSRDRDSSLGARFAVCIGQLADNFCPWSLRIMRPSQECECYPSNASVILAALVYFGKWLVAYYKLLPLRLVGARLVLKPADCAVKSYWVHSASCWCQPPASGNELIRNSFNAHTTVSNTAIQSQITDSSIVIQ